MLKKIGITLGLLSLLYFVSYAVLTGLSNLFTYVWLLLGILLLLLSIFQKP